MSLKSILVGVVVAAFAVVSFNAVAEEKAKPGAVVKKPAAAVQELTLTGKLILKENIKGDVKVTDQVKNQVIAGKRKRHNSTYRSKNTMNNSLSMEVQMQFIRPAQLEAALRKFPVVYVPFGLIEWHGRHLPLGNDALKAHAILVKCAEQFGGVVYPPVYFPHTRYVKDSEDLHPEENDWKIAMLTALFNRIKATGARVIIGVSGHNIPQQIAWINKALEPVVADGTVAGIGLHEITLSQGEESNSDHAAKWETSNMMFFYPDLVNMSELGTGPLALNMEPPDGIGGLDPRKHASVDVGRRNVELATAAIGRKAKELLESLPEGRRSFNLPAISPPHWWCI